MCADTGVDDAVAALRAVVGDAGLVTDAASRACFLVDERRLYQGRAAAIVQPRTSQALSAVMRICYARDIAMVPQGGNTGYCGGATPDDSGRQVVISLARMNDIRALDPVGFTLTVEAGVILADARHAAAAQGMLLPLSMGSEGSCQIGGNLSTNAGGLSVLRYGMARDLVLGLEVVLPDGRLWHGLKALRKDNTGYDLKQLFLGAEGTLGVVTAAVVKLFPAPDACETLWLAVPDLDAACALLGLTRRIAGDCATSFEYVSRRSLDYVLRYVAGTRDPLGGDYRHAVLLELATAGELVDLARAAEAIVTRGSAAGLILDGTIAQNEHQRSALWRLRETIPEAEKRAGGSIKHDISVAIGRIGEFTVRAARALAGIAPGAGLSVYGHVGDGNLHFNVLAAAPGAAPAFRRRCAREVSATVHGLAAAMEGSFSAEHGVGQLKRELLAARAGATALDLMRRVKTALDPKGLMNPGKVL